MKQEIKLGVTDRTVIVFIPDPASTVGKGKTGLVAADLTVSYMRVETDNDVTVTDVTSSLNNLSALTDAHNDWGIKEVSATLAAGHYRLDIGYAVFAAGAWSAVVSVCITSGLSAASPMEFILVAFDPLDTVRLGLTALPNAAADAAGGLVISDAGGLDADAQRADVAAILVDTGTTLDGRIPAALVSGRMDACVGAMAANVMTAAAAAADLTTELQSGLATAAALTITDGKVDAIKTKTDNLPVDPADQSLIIAATDAVMARLGAPAGASMSADISAVQSDTNDIQTRLPAALTGAGNMKADALALNGDATSAANIAKTTRAIGRGTAGAGGTTTSIPTSAFTPAGAAADQFKGRIVTFDADTTTTALRGQSTDITASTNAAAPTLTVSALTTAPTSGDTFSIT